MDEPDDDDVCKLELTIMKTEMLMTLLAIEAGMLCVSFDKGVELAWAQAVEESGYGFDPECEHEFIVIEGAEPDLEFPEFEEAEDGPELSGEAEYRRQMDEVIPGSPGVCGWDMVERGLYPNLIELGCFGIY